MSMSRPAADVAIVGCGIIGLAAAERLTADGRSVAIIDQAGLAAGATGASGGLVRAVDMVGHRQAPAVSLHRYLRRGWRSRWPPVREHGSLTLVKAADHERAPAAAAAAAAAGHQVSLLTADEIAARFPGLRLPADYAGIYEPRAGWLPARAVANAMLRDARDGDGGLRLLRERATGVLTAGPRVVGVQTTAGRVLAKTVLLAAGVGSASLAQSVGVPLALCTRSVSFCLFETGEPGAAAGLPTVVDTTTGGWLRRWWPGRPEVGGTVLGRTVLVGVTSAKTGVPPIVRHSVPTAEQQRVRSVMEDRFPALARARPVGGVTAYDAMTVGGDGAVTAWPQPCGLITATGWNGGGFKLAPAVGAHVADLIREVLD